MTTGPPRIYLRDAENHTVIQPFTRETLPTGTRCMAFRGTPYYLEASGLPKNAAIGRLDIDFLSFVVARENVGDAPSKLGIQKFDLSDLIRLGIVDPNPGTNDDGEFSSARPFSTTDLGIETVEYTMPFPQGVNVDTRQSLQDHVYRNTPTQIIIRDPTRNVRQGISMKWGGAGSRTGAIAPGGGQNVVYYPLAFDIAGEGAAGMMSSANPCGWSAKDIQDYAAGVAASLGAFAPAPPGVFDVIDTATELLNRFRGP